jgi:hypothetical protein
MELYEPFDFGCLSVELMFGFRISRSLSSSP